MGPSFDSVQLPKLSDLTMVYGRYNSIVNGVCKWHFGGGGLQDVTKGHGKRARVCSKNGKPRRSPFFYAPNFDYVSHAVEGKELLGESWCSILDLHITRLRTAKRFFVNMELIPSGKRT